MINFGTESFRVPNTSAERQKISDIKASILLPAVLPYMGRLGHRLRYVLSDDLGSIIITKKGVIVFDAQMLAEIGVPELAAEVAHLWIHWLMDHANRAMRVDLDEGGNFYASIWNVAADCHCLEGLKDTPLMKHMPDNLTSFGDLNISPQTHAERTYAVLLKEFVERKLKKEGLNASLPDDFSFEDFLNGTGDGPPGKGEPGDGEDESDTKSENDYERQIREFEDEFQDELDAKLQAFLEGADRGFKGDIWELPEELFNSGIDPFQGTHKYCGSGAGHIPLDNEGLLNALLHELGDDALTEAEADLIRNGVASDIQEFFNKKGRGDMPGDYERFCNERLQKPTVPWRQKLKTAVTRPLARKAGQVDYTFARPHKRQKPGQLRIPAMINSDPGRCAVMVDTSGSMSETDLKIALSEIQGILQDYQVVGFAVDAACHEVGPIKDASSFSLKGGGGTDMCVGIKHVSEEKPPFTSVVVLTDGDTPWPEKPYDANLKLQVVAAIITDQEEDGYRFRDVPDWIEVVRIPATPLG